MLKTRSYLSADRAARVLTKAKGRKTVDPSFRISHSATSPRSGATTSPRSGVSGPFAADGGGPFAADGAFCISSRCGQARLQRLERPPAAPGAQRLRAGSDCGQAMVELTVALIVIVMLLAGLIQIGQITAAHTRTMIAARAQAAQGAMAATYSQPLDAHYIYTWITGPDHKCYTRDDVPLVATNTVDDTLTILAMARPDELKDYVPNNALSTRGMSADTMDEFFLVRGHDSESCPILPVIRNLAYDQESISVESEAWLVWTEGIY